MKQKRIMTVRARLMFIVILSVLLLLGIFVAELQSENRIAQKWGELREIETKATSLSRMQAAFGYNGIIHHFKNYVLRQEPQYIERIQAAYERFVEAHTLYASLPNLSAAEQSELATVLGTVNEYRDAMDTAQSLFDSGVGIEEVDDTVRIDDGPAIQALATLGQEIQVAVTRTEDEFDRVLRTGLVTLISIAVAGILIQVSVSFFMARTIGTRLRAITEATSIVASGDLSRGIELEGRDELGRIAADYDASIGALRTVLSTVQQTSRESAGLSEALEKHATTLAEAGGAIDTSIQDLGRGVSGLQASVDNSSSSVEEILASIGSLSNRIGNQSDAVQTTSAAVEQMNSSIQSVSRIAQTREQASKLLSETIESGGVKLSGANEFIESASASVDAILSLIEIINSVAEQTNLLSMNAAIEAAHAGESGRGFAVVAEEIRKLADTTAENAMSIATTLKKVVTDIESAREASRAAQESFVAIDSSAKEAIDAFHEISASTAELGAGSTEILKATADLVEITTQISSGAEEIEAGAREIVGSVSKVKQIVHETRSELDQISSNSGQIAVSSAEMEKITSQTASGALKLSEELSKFST